MFNTVVAFPLHAVCQLLMAANMTCGAVSTDVRMPGQTVLPNGFTEFPEIGVAYRYHNYDRTWNLAKRDCAARGASLAIIDSFKKIDYVLKIMNSTKGSWIGIHRFFDDAEWVSLKTGSPLATIPWAPNEPESGKLHQKCAGLWNDGRGLFSNGCNETYHFVCEFGL